MAPAQASISTHVIADAVIVGQSDATPAADYDAYDILLTETVDPPRPWVKCDSLAALESSVQSSPGAATALVQVLRATESLPPDAALTIESMAYSMLQHGSVFQRWLQTRKRHTPRTETDEPVRLERSDGRLDIVLQRPAVHNALNAAMRDALCEAFELVAADAAITDVHLRSDGPSFCSGGDLDEFGTATDAVAAHIIRVARNVGRRIHQCKARVTAHLHGACIGAGIEISAFAGRVVADPDTTISLPEVAMGLIPGAGGTIGIPRRIGRHRTALLALTGASIDANTARSWGLVDDLRDRIDSTHN